MKRLFFILPMLLIIAFSACEKKQQQTQTMAAAGMHNVVVDEVLQANKYTYLLVSEGSARYWIAITKADIKVGEKISFGGALEMNNFVSKDLNRTFETVYFVQEIQKTNAMASQSMPAMPPGAEKARSTEKEDISIEAPTGGLTIAKIYSDSKNLSGQEVKVRGKVVKYNPMIMGRNWVHIQDGTDANGNFDLTVTTTDQVNLGDIVTFTGTVGLNKDFGAGYAYDVIVENAKAQILN